MKILLIAGGWSTEREVSLRGAESVANGLKAKGHEITLFDLQKNFDELLPQASIHDFAFINLHGAPGEDGLVQAMLDSIHCPYQGSGPAASFLALNKAAAKQVFRFNNLPTADWIFLPRRPAPDWQPKLDWPFFVKSNTGGSSLRLGKVGKQRELQDALNEIFTAGEEALIEPAIKGRDLTCGILGHQALPPVLIEPLEGEFFDYKSKYAAGGARELCPPPLPAELILKAQELALQAHSLLGLQGYSRVDFLVDDQERLFILEANTLPGMTATSLLPQEAKAAGLDFPELLETLIQLGLRDHPRK